MPNYRALVSLPLEAADDAYAIRRADEFAANIQEDGVVVGHVELVGEAGEGVSVRRAVFIDPGFAGQVP